MQHLTSMGWNPWKDAGFFLFLKWPFLSHAFSKTCAQYTFAYGFRVHMHTMHLHCLLPAVTAFWSFGRETEVYMCSVPLWSLVALKILIKCLLLKIKPCKAALLSIPLWFMPNFKKKVIKMIRWLSIYDTRRILWLFCFPLSQMHGFWEVAPMHRLFNKHNVHVY